jgi:hypothetical protein
LKSTFDKNTNLLFIKSLFSCTLFIFVYTISMKNITFSAEDASIAKARSLAQLRGTTLNEEFRLWLASYASADTVALKKAQTMSLIEQLTARQGQQSAVPIAYAYTAEDQRPAVRDAFNERELRMLNRLDETSNATRNATGNTGNAS